MRALGACGGLVQQRGVERGPPDSPYLQPGAGALRVEQAAEIQEYRAYAAPHVEPGQEY